MEVELGNLPFDLDFHPSGQLVAAGVISGDLLMYRYAADSAPERLLKVNAHTESCRAVRFINDGRNFSILATDVETGAAIARLENSHGAAVNRIINVTESTVASGDDEGCMKVWDTRQRSCCNTFEVHEEYISDMTFASDSMKLIGTSGDGTLSVCNLRSNKVQTRSEFSEDELLSVVIMKNGRKLICGTQTGTLLLYSWGFFKDCSDRFVDLAPNSVDAMLKLDEDRLIAGSENGLISLVGILPNRIIQPIAEHSEYPIERLAFSYDRKYLGSISHDQTLKLWDLDEILPGSGMTRIIQLLLTVIVMMEWMLTIPQQNLPKEPSGRMQVKGITMAVQAPFSPTYDINYMDGVEILAPGMGNTLHINYIQLVF